MPEEVIWVIAVVVVFGPQFWQMVRDDAERARIRRVGVWRVTF